MGTCFSRPTVGDPRSLDTRDVISQEPSLPQLQGGAEPGREPAQVTIEEPSYGRRRARDRVQSTPHKVSNMNDVAFPPTPRQRTKSSFASPSSSSRNPNPDHRRTSTSECDHDRARGASLTMTRALEDRPQTNWNEFSPLPAAQLYSAGSDSRRLEVRSSTTLSYLQLMYITHVLSIGSDFSLWGRCAQLIFGKPLLELIRVPTQSGSGKSSLIKAVFKVDVTVRSHPSVTFTPPTLR